MLFWIAIGIDCTVDILGTSNKCEGEKKELKQIQCAHLYLLLFLSFGYVVDGAEFLEDMDEGDIIVSAKVTEGAENLVQPR